MPDWAAGALKLSAVALAVLVGWFWLYDAAFPLVVLSALLLTSVLLLFCDVCLLPRRQPSPPPPRPRPRPAQQTAIAMAEVAQMARGLAQLARQAAQALEEEQQEAIAEEEAYAHEE